MFFHVILCEQIYKLYLKKQKFKIDFYSRINVVYSCYYYKIRVFLLFNENQEFCLFASVLMKSFVISYLSLVTIKVSSSLSSGSPRILSRI